MAPWARSKSRVSQWTFQAPRPPLQGQPPQALCEEGSYRGVGLPAGRTGVAGQAVHIAATGTSSSPLHSSVLFTHLQSGLTHEPQTLPNVH